MKNENNRSTDFKHNDFRNHILNEYNIPLTDQIVNKIFRKYNFNHSVQDLQNFQIALTHVSYLRKSIIKDKTAAVLKTIEPISDENKKTVMPLQKRDYNTYEFQGDALIHLALTQYLYHRYPTSDQGFLTKLRTKLEKDETHSLLAKRLTLDRYIVIAKNMELNGARHNDIHLTGDVYESFMCALFLEQPYDKCKEFIISVIEKEIDFPELINSDDNYKEKIMHHFHKMKWKDPSYVESKYSQKNNLDAMNQVIVINLQNAENEILGTGSGNTKTKAEQHAAKDALERLGVLKPIAQTTTYYGEQSSPPEPSSLSTPEEEIDYLAWFKDRNFINHILNEKNTPISESTINNLFAKYNFAHKAKNYQNYLISTIHVSYLEKTSLKDKTATLLKDIPAISEESKTTAFPLQKKDYSRLAHLGNATIHLILTQYLCKRYSAKDQGFLTKLRTKLERAETLSFLAKQLNFDKHAIIARNMEMNDSRSTDINLTKGIFEAFIGSISLETNYYACYSFLTTLIEREIDLAELLESDDNYKDKIMQYCHKRGWKDLKYVDVKCDTEKKTFVICVKNQQGETLGTGTANTKNKAEQQAAYDALVKLGVITNEEAATEYYGE